MRRFEQLQFDNIYAKLPPIFYSRHQPQPLQNQFLIHFNSQVASTLGLDVGEADRDDLIELITMVKPIEGFEPIAMCYAGHQFGQFVPRLGDGRAIMLGQLIDENSNRWDLQLKGAGQTLYSRQGDGKAVLRSTIREHLCSAAMQGLGIPSTLSLAMFGSQEPVYREKIETGAMLIRVAPSHIRFGSFEYFFYTRRFDDLATLADFTIENYFSELQEKPDKYLLLLDKVVQSTARLLAQWQAVGFCHGVMNSDNMSVHGITIDYGPFGFLDRFDPEHICNHSDYQGRYAFKQQPSVALFNLSCLAQALLPLLDGQPEAAAEKATSVLKRYEPAFDREMLQLKCSKLGLIDPLDGDGAIYDDLLGILYRLHGDFTQSFRKLSEKGGDGLVELFEGASEITQWVANWRQRQQDAEISSSPGRQMMLETNPKYILRNHFAENAIRMAEDHQDYSEIDKLVTLLGSPYSNQDGMDQFSEPPEKDATPISVSCSS